MKKYDSVNRTKYDTPILTIPGQYATGYFYLRYGVPKISVQSKGPTATEFPMDAINDLLMIVNKLNDKIIEWDTQHREQVQDA